MRRREMYNTSGCLDMTAYIALRNIEREKAAAARAREAMYRKNMQCATTSQWYRR